MTLVKRVLCISVPTSLISAIGRQCGTFDTWQWESQHGCYWLKPSLVQISLHFTWFSVYAPGSHLGPHTVFIHHVPWGFSWLWQLFWLSLSSMTLVALRSTSQGFWRTFLNSSLSDFPPHDYTGVMDSEEAVHGSTISYCLLKDTWLTAAHGALKHTANSGRVSQVSSPKT